MGGFLIVNGNFFLWFLIYFEGSDTIKLLRALLVFGVACLVSPVRCFKQPGLPPEEGPRAQNN